MTQKNLKLTMKSAASSLLSFVLSAVLWIIAMFLLGVGSIVIGVNILLGPGAAFVAAGIGMLSACFLLKRAVTNV